MKTKIDGFAVVVLANKERFWSVQDVLKVTFYKPMQYK